MPNRPSPQVAARPSLPRATPPGSGSGGRAGPDRRCGPRGSGFRRIAHRPVRPPASARCARVPGAAPRVPPLRSRRWAAFPAGAGHPGERVRAPAGGRGSTTEPAGRAGPRRARSHPGRRGDPPDRLAGVALCLWQEREARSAGLPPRRRGCGGRPNPGGSHVHAPEWRPRKLQANSAYTGGCEQDGPERAQSSPSEQRTDPARPAALRRGGDASIVSTPGFGSRRARGLGVSRPFLAYVMLIDQLQGVGLVRVERVREWDMIFAFMPESPPRVRNAGRGGGAHRPRHRRAPLRAYSRAIKRSAGRERAPG